jgi:predicted phosphodiesterase
MSTLVFADTHFGKKFHQRQFDALKTLISKSGRIIINGDFWEGLGISFDDFIKSDWNKLFPLLKEKETIYVYGNHDDKIYSDDRVYLFCHQAVSEYLLNTPSQSYLFRHGHQFLFPRHSDECIRKHIKQAGTRWRRFRLAVANIIQSVGFGLFGPKILPGFLNYISAKDRRSIGIPGQLLVCGHTHRPYINKKGGFLDIGFFNFGWANYLLIDDTGKYYLTSKRY